MSLTPLVRLLLAFALAMRIRFEVHGQGFWCWTSTHDWGNLKGNDVLWLPVRWGQERLRRAALAARGSTPSI